MSPILKRDISEHIIHARRDITSPQQSYEQEWVKSPDAFASGSSPRQGIGIDDEEVKGLFGDGEWRRTNTADRKGKGRTREEDELEARGSIGGEESDEDVGEGVKLLKPNEIGEGQRVERKKHDCRREELEYEYGELDKPPLSSAREKWIDLRSLLLEVGQSRFTSGWYPTEVNSSGHTISPPESRRRGIHR